MKRTRSAIDVFHPPGSQITLTIAREGMEKDYLLKSEGFRMSAIGLTVEQVKKAKNWEKAGSDRSFAFKLGLSPEQTQEC